MKNIDVSLVIVTYHSQKVIKKCLASLGKNARQQVIIVDNSVSNIGFAAGANKGAKRATGKYLLFLNPDTIVNNGAILKSIKYLEKHKNIAVLGCKTLNADGSLQFSCGHFPTPTNIIFYKHLIRNPAFYRKIQETDWVSGAFMLVRRDIFEKLNGFDEKYFMYTEDVDFCYRVKKLGYKVVYFPGAQIIHLDEGKLPSRHFLKTFHILRGFLTFFLK